MFEKMTYADLLTVSTTPLETPGVVRSVSKGGLEYIVKYVQAALDSIVDGTAISAGHGCFLLDAPASYENPELMYYCTNDVGISSMSMCCGLAVVDIAAESWGWAIIYGQHPTRLLTDAGAEFSTFGVWAKLVDVAGAGTKLDGTSPGVGTTAVGFARDAKDGSEKVAFQVSMPYVIA